MDPPPPERSPPIAALRLHADEAAVLVIWMFRSRARRRSPSARPLVNFPALLTSAVQAAEPSRRLRRRGHRLPGPFVSGQGTQPAHLDSQRLALIVQHARRSPLRTLPTHSGVLRCTWRAPRRSRAPPCCRSVAMFAPPVYDKEKFCQSRTAWVHFEVEALHIILNPSQIIFQNDRHAAAALSPQCCEMRAIGARQPTPTRRSV